MTDDDLNQRMNQFEHELVGIRARLTMIERTMVNTRTFHGGLIASAGLVIAGNGFLLASFHFVMGNPGQQSGRRDQPDPWAATFHSCRGTFVTRMMKAGWTGAVSRRSSPMRTNDDTEIRPPDRQGVIGDATAKMNAQLAEGNGKPKLRAVS